MSAPDTNVKKEARRHSPAFIGMGVAVLVAFAAAIFFNVWDNPAPSDGEVLPPAMTGTDG